MPLGPEQRIALRQKFYPAADDRTFGILGRALDRHLRKGAAVLDAGSGSGTWLLRRFAGRIGLLAGADLQPPATMPNGEGRPGGVKPVLADLTTLPFADERFDLILCYDVIEHLSDPPAVFAQFHRLLTAGGMLLFQTPAAYSPTILLSRLLPVAVHRHAKSGLGIGGGDVFPTHYRCNTPRRIERALSAAGFQRELLETFDQTYDYLYFSGFTYACGLFYSRAVALPGLGWLRNVIAGVYRR